MTGSGAVRMMECVWWVTAAVNSINFSCKKKKKQDYILVWMKRKCPLFHQLRKISLHMTSIHGLPSEMFALNWIVRNYWMLILNVARFVQIQQQQVNSAAAPEKQDPNCSICPKIGPEFGLSLKKESCYYGSKNRTWQQSKLFAKRRKNLKYKNE